MREFEEVPEKRAVWSLRFAVWYDHLLEGFTTLFIDNSSITQREH